MSVLFCARLFCARLCARRLAAAGVFAIGGAAAVLAARSATAAETPSRPASPPIAAPVAVPVAAVVTAARLLDHADEAELSFTISRPVESSVFTLAAPDRIILDLPEVSFRIDQAAVDPGRTGRGGHGRHHSSPDARLIESVRFGALAPGRSRVVIDLGAPARVLKAGMASDAAGAPILLLKLRRGEAGEAGGEVGVAEKAAQPPAPPVAPTAPGGRGVAGVMARPVVVIDPGHGGPDRGAERNGIAEKDLTLGFARALAARLERGGRYAVVLTRSDDTFVPLSERVDIARRSGAALMISVHADALPEAAREAAEVGGATVYTVSERASDSYAAAVAAKENSADAAAGGSGQAGTADVADILFDLTRQETRAYSHSFARTLVNYWKVVGRLNKNPQRAAGFVVLKAPDVPSVLVELGYLSNPADAAALQSDDWRGRASGRMGDAVDSYFAGRLDAPQLRAGLAAPR